MTTRRSRHVSIKSPGLISITETMDLRDISVSVERDGGGYRATIRARREHFHGKGLSPSTALQDLLASIANAAVKQYAKGRTPDRARVAATLLHGE
jgi:hypothetical protein